MNSSVNIFLFVFTFAVVIHSCKNETSKIKDNERTAERQRFTEQSSYTFITPLPNHSFTIGQMLEVSLQKNDTIPVDSLKLVLGDNSVRFLPDKSFKVKLPSVGLNPGITRLKLNIYLTDGKIQSLSIPVKFLSDIVPQEYTYRIVQEYPHDRAAYTQGFEYSKNHFYEGTGQYGESSIRKTVYNTGEVIKYKKLSSDLFGEGITLLNGKIYQITYQTKIGFIYDMETFEQLQRIYYQNQEGWGLTNNGTDIIMSDGTNILYFMDPEYFSIRHKIEVYDNVQAVDSLNELEYIEGLIYANRYLSDQIVIIDPQTGKVTGKINLNGLLKPGDSHSGTDVLNGIAWDKDNKRLFVTGKYWPKIFHIELINR